jgi:Plasmid pRiA4b ORF-3-like protein
MPKPHNEKAVLVRAQLRRVKPAVWRRLLVPGGVRLDKFHLVIQTAMGWTNSHLHSFTVGRRIYGPVYEEDLEDTIIDVDETTMTLGEVVRTETQILYEYDFGDSWEHDVVVEDRLSTESVLKFAVCLDGKNACPPEDSGGPGGYRTMLASLADPADDEHDSYLQWLGGPFDPTVFSLAEVNAALQRLR